MILPDYIQNIEDKENTHVFVAMSGGVDSSVSAYLLKKAGFRVTGCFMTVWQPPFLDCSMESERQDAMRVAVQLGIDFKTVDLAEDYKTRVVDYMIAEYEAGRTPNPDVMCNGEIKFGAFFDWAEDRGADYVATGHYAQLRKSKVESRKSKVELVAGADEHKDQTYFMWQVLTERLEKTIFPIGHLEKSKVREIAAEAELPVADKKDSQGLCFLGQVDMPTFLAEFIDLEPGDVLNEAGDVIGTHAGSVVYTIGQRHGFSIQKKTPESGPWYVISKDVDANTITVTENDNLSSTLYNCKGLTLPSTNWIGDVGELLENGKLSARIRYNQPLQKCTVKGVGGKDQVEVTFDQPLRAVAVGQSCVVYDGERCLGGGIIGAVRS
ncbi:MAG: tRNA 2-thiouridine(34) synthase MnmA [Candidatus Paceibacterota bacterium]